MFWFTLKVAAKHNKVFWVQLAKALEKEYGSKVSKEDVDKAYKQASEQYGINSHKYLQPMVKQKSHTVIKSVHKNWLSMLLTKPHKRFDGSKLQGCHDNYTPNTEGASGFNYW